MHGARWASALTLGTAKRQDEKGHLWCMQLELGSSRGGVRGGASEVHRHVDIWGQLVNTTTGEHGLQGIPDKGGKLSNLGNMKRRKEMEELAEHPADG